MTHTLDTQVTASQPPADPPPLRSPLHAPVAQLVRSGMVESVHYGSVVVLAADGSIDFQLGDIEAAFYPRSALKPVQAVGLLRAGLSLDGPLLALAAGSHSGEERHQAATRRILDLGRLSETDLRNVPDLPYDPAVRDQWLRDGRGPTRCAQNCSGKHAAMLATARLLGWSTEDYLDPDHPVQRAIAATVADLTGQRVARVSVDGCGAPLFAVSLHGLARAMARLVTGAQDTPLARVANAIRNHPEMASGSGRDVARLMRAVPGLLAKDGFEGVQAMALPDGRAIAVKIADGGDRARGPVAAAALARCGVSPAVLAEFTSTPLRGGSTSVGALQPAPELALAAGIPAAPRPIEQHHHMKEDQA